jgi:hypothetical protein
MANKHIEYYNLTDYIENYNLRLNAFCDRIVDTDEIDFLENDLYQFNSYLEYSIETEKSIWNKITSDNSAELLARRKDIINSLRSYKKIVELIEKRIKEGVILKNDSNSELAITPPTTKQNTLKWHGTHLQLSELVKPLYDLKLISPELTQKEVFNRLKMFFELADFKENEKLKDIRNRTNTTTPFINILENTLNNWIKNKD